MLNYFVTGTGTDIGKTVVTTLLAAFLSDQATRIIPFKPIQTGAHIVNGALVAPDQAIYNTVLSSETTNGLDTYVFKTASSPHFAAKRENNPISIKRIRNEISQLQTKCEGIVVEGAGGLYVPITESGYCMIDLMKELKFPVILVADAGVGTINHTVLSIRALHQQHIPVTGVLFNCAGQHDQLLEEDNKNMIEKMTNVPVLGTVPFIENIERKLPNEEVRRSLTKDWNKQLLTKEHINEYRTITTVE